MIRWNSLGLVGLLGIASAYGCGSSNSTDVQQDDATNDIGSDVPCVDGFVPADPSADAGACLTARTCDNSNFCPSTVVNNTMTPKFVIAQISVSTPAVLGTHSLVGNLLNSSITAGKFFWGLSVDFNANSMTTGAVLTNSPAMDRVGFFNNDFHYIMGGAPGGDAGSADRWNPTTTTITASGDSFSTSTIAMLTVPVFGTATDGGAPGLLAELPLRNVSMHDVHMDATRNCIGLARSPFNSCLSSGWATQDSNMTPAGVIEGDITLEDADHVILVDLGNKSLCAFIIGLQTLTCAETPMANWPTTNAPMSTSSGLGWHLVANFAAFSATIQ